MHKLRWYEWLLLIAERSSSRLYQMTLESRVHEVCTRSRINLEIIRGRPFRQTSKDRSSLLRREPKLVCELDVTEHIDRFGVTHSNVSENRSHWMTFEYYGCRHVPKVLSGPRKRLCDNPTRLLTVGVSGSLVYVQLEHSAYRCLKAARYHRNFVSSRRKKRKFVQASTRWFQCYDSNWSARPVESQSRPAQPLRSDRRHGR